MITVTDPNLTSTQRYKPVEEAGKAKEAAREAWKQAYLAWEKDPLSQKVRQDLIDTSIAFRRASDEFREVSIAFKHNKGTVSGLQSGTTLQD